MSNRSMKAIAVAALFLPTIAYADNAKVVERPMAVLCETQFAFAGPTTVLLTGTCNVRHLGLSTIAAEQEVTFNADGTATIIHDSVYTAANGDQLFSVVTATGVFLSPTLIALSGTEAFSGGTGRFVDAAGSANVAGVAQLTGPSGGVGMFSTQGRLAY